MVPKNTLTPIDGVMANGSVVIAPISVRMLVPTISPEMIPRMPRTSASSKRTPRKKRGPYPIALNVAYSRR